MLEKSIKGNNLYLINKTDKNIAIIKNKDDSIHIEFYKNTKFIEIVKKFLYKWNGIEWVKEINKFTPLIEDSMAEIAKELSDNYINIEIRNDKAFELFRENEFQKETFRWIVTSKESDDLIFFIRHSKENKIIKKIKTLSAIRYSKGYYKSKINNYEEVFEFAKKNDFEISKIALQKAMEFETKFTREYNKNIFN